MAEARIGTRIAREPALAAVASLSNLYRASRAARRHKRRFPYVRAFEGELETQLLRLAEQLRGGDYRPGEFHVFRVTKPKPRLISAAPYRDRVVHHAVVRVLEPFWERRFIHHTYACRKGKGTHAALDACQKFARRFPFVLHADVRKYFPSVDHALLLRLLFRQVRDQGLQSLLHELVAHTGRVEEVYDHFAGDELFTPLERRKGLPIGNLTSQFFGNVFLDGLDHHVTDGLGFGAYLRYMDDVLVFGSCRRELELVRGEIERFLEQNRLKLHRGKRALSRTRDGVRILGFRVFPTHRRVTYEGKRRQARRLRKLQELFAGGRLELERLRCSVAAMRGHLLHANTYYYRCRRSKEVCFSGASSKRYNGRGTQSPNCRAANRNDNEPENANDNNGLRVAARSTPQEKPEPRRSHGRRGRA